MQSSPRPVSLKTSPSIPLVCVRRCRVVTELVTSGSATRNPGSTSATGASRSSRPSSTSCMTSVAVHTFVIEPIWKSESGVTSTPVALLSTPVPVVVIDPSDRIPSAAPGTR